MAWVTLGIEEHGGWPSTDHEVIFDGKSLHVIAETETTLPAVQVKYGPPTTQDDALELLRRFLSACSWANQRRFVEAMSVGAGSHPAKIGKPLGGKSIAGLALELLPDVRTDEQQLALALYREALGQRWPWYAFLSFFRIINIKHSTGGQQKAWINSVLPDIRDHHALERLAELRSSTSDIGAYLYTDGRCAVAHASEEPVASPDVPSDVRRLSKDLPLMKAIAEHAIEFDFGLKSTETLIREHLYELDGFRRLFGPEAVCRIKAREKLEPSSLPPVPLLAVRVRDWTPFSSLERLTADVVSVDLGVVEIELRSEDPARKALRGNLTLDFAEERLRIDPYGGFAVGDDGSSIAVEAAIDCVRFSAAMTRNGRLEVWAVGSSLLFGRCGSFIPMNIDLQKTLAGFESEILHLESLKSQRMLEEQARRKPDVPQS